MTTRADAIARARAHLHSGAFLGELGRRVAYRTESQNPGSGEALRAYLVDDLQPAFAALGGDGGAKAIVSANRARTRTVALPGDHARVVVRVHGGEPVTVDELLKKCGQPASVRSEESDTRAMGPNGGMIKIGTSITEYWTYDRGTQAKAVIVTIRDGKIRSIERDES